MKVLVERKSTKISEAMNKVYICVVIVEGFDSATYIAKLVNEQMRCNASIQIVIRILKAISFEAHRYSGQKLSH